MVGDPDTRRFKSAADVDIDRDSQAAAFRRHNAWSNSLGHAPPDFPLARLEDGDWLGWAKSYLEHRIGPKEPLRTYGSGESGIFGMPDKGQVALYGDWASGTEVANRVAGHIRSAAPAHTIHLGDVYFVGDENEAAENFLGDIVEGSPWCPVAYPPGTKRSFALNGNHEMYARGRGYFERILPALGQPASFFALENEYWRILGLDTGYESITEPLWEMLDHPDCHLPDQVMDWIKPSLERTAGKGTILLSHHQPYSFYNPGYPKIAQQIVTLLGGPVLWFWGHEHCLSIYDRVNPAGSLEVYGRCVRHGGMPCERPGSQSNGSYPVLIQDHRPGSLGGPFWRNGYSMLDFDGPKLRIEYRDDGDALVAHEAWEVDGGVIKATVPPIADVSGVSPPV